MGLWESGPYEYGSMEASCVGFRADGSGWSVWENAGGAALTMLRWSRLGPQVIQVVEVETFFGTWAPGTRRLILDESGDDHEEPAGGGGDVIELRYEIVEDVPPLADGPMVVLKLAEPYEGIATYALSTRDIDSVDVPAVVV
ncbi:hypothetical protein SAMN05421748_106159 [Paractinoplanes atraurantiacus]|uniref:Uncharacterized protein n=1 Tax=Paractinoplanes atraurantiacus TaxID=1036182 RepID=A0A285I0F6_9ACTN|nr:hypothetical protein SAMN05421748_106159 [Actinoplanes atraurantiacus]